MKPDQNDLIALIGFAMLLGSVIAIYTFYHAFIVVGGLMMCIGLWRAK